MTTSGFNDPYNYGGRVMKSTDSGLFVGTANPFYGCQVWKVEEGETSGSGSGGGGGCFIDTAGSRGVSSGAVSDRTARGLLLALLPAAGWLAGRRLTARR